MTDPNVPNSESSSFEADDLKVAAFLKANRPPVPAPHPQAESRLMQAIADTQQQAQPQPQQTNRASGLKRGWLIGAAFISALIGTVLWQLNPQGSGVLAQREIELEAFLIETWQDVSDSDDDFGELDWLSTQESVSQADPVSDRLTYQSYLEESHP